MPSKSATRSSSQAIVEFHHSVDHRDERGSPDQGSYKWFEFGKDEDGNELSKTVISREYSSEWKPGDEPYYPVNDEKNSALYT